MPVVNQLEHAADYLVEITALDKSDLLQGGIQAIAAHCVADPCELSSHDVTIQEPCVVQADCFEELFIRFLNEVLYKMDEQNAAFFDIQLKSVTDTGIDGILNGVSRTDVAMEGEIKSATYHNYVIKYEDNTIRAIVLFDV